MRGKHIAGIDASMQRTQIWLKEISEELHGADRPQSYAALRSVLHALRDCLPPHEVVKLAAQMPLVVRGIFYDGWRLREKPLRLGRYGFYNMITRSLGTIPEVDAAMAAQAVIRCLYKHVSPGALRGVRNVLPTEVRALWREIEVDLFGEPAPPPARAERGTRRAHGPGTRALRRAPVRVVPSTTDGEPIGGLGPRGDL